MFSYLFFLCNLFKERQKQSMSIPNSFTKIFVTKNIFPQTKLSNFLPPFISIKNL